MSAKVLDFNATPGQEAPAMSPMLAAALEYLDQGFSIIPIAPGGKRPPSGFSWKEYQKRPPTEEEVESWFRDYPGANIALVTGEVSGVVAVDADGPEGLAWVDRNFPAPAVHQKTAKGVHAFFKWPGTPVKNAVRLAPEVDFRGDGGYVVIAPSVHPSGVVYQLEMLPGRNGWEDLDAFEWPQEEKSTLPTAPAEVREGARNDTLTKKVGRWAGKGLDHAEVLTLAFAWNAQFCRPPLSQSEVETICKSITSREAAKNSPRPERRPGLDGASLIHSEFSEPRWAVPGIISEGLNILGGKPKLGKSWLCLGLGLSISGGKKALGSFQVEKGEVLYLALEDTLRRLKSRLESILQGMDLDMDDLKNIHFETEWPRMPEGIELLDAWMQKHPDTRLIIVDTFSRFRPASRPKNIPQYDLDYQHAGEIKKFADAYGVAVLLVHHLRKSEADDIMDAFSGSNGFTGAADTLLPLERGRGKDTAKLHVTGRDVEERTLALEWDAELTSWRYTDNMPELIRSSERQAIIEVLRQTGGPMKAAAITEGIGKEAKLFLSRMVKDGEIERVERGVYALPLGRNEDVF